MNVVAQDDVQVVAKTNAVAAGAVNVDAWLPTPESVRVTVSAVASTMLTHAFPEPSKAPWPRVYEAASVTSVLFT